MTNRASIVLTQTNRYNKISSQFLFCSGLFSLTNKFPCRAVSNQNVNKPVEKFEKDTSRPYKFTTSAANTPIILGHKGNKYQSYIVSASLAVFMIYFFYLREENDLDELIYEPIQLAKDSSNQETKK